MSNISELSIRTEDQNFNKSISPPKNDKQKKNITIKDIYNYAKNKKNIYFKFSVFLAFFLIYFLYISSLEKCYKGFDICSAEINWIKTKIRHEIYSCILLSIIIELIIYKIISRIHLIHIIFTFILFYVYSHGLDFDDHGFFNFIFYFILLILILLSFLPFNGLIYFIKRKNRILIGIYGSFIIISFIFITSYYYYISKCENWAKGLNNTYIDNSIGCKINIPKVCPYNFLKKIQDITKLKGINCKIDINKIAKNNILKMSTSPYINNYTNRIEYPLTNKDPICFVDFIDNDNLIEKYFMENLVDMDNKEILNKFYHNKMPEIQIDFSDDPAGKMIINLYYNKTLSKERYLIEKEKKIIPYSENILILYIDSVSRANSLRKLKNTTKFFEKFMSYKGYSHKKYPKENFHSFQFFKYHSFYGHTRTNFPILFYGEERNSTMVLINKYFKENGYITGYVGDYCDKNNVRMYHNLTTEEIHDHQFIICDPNKMHYNTLTIKCLYGKQIIEHLYEYGDQFWRKYKKNRKFLSIITNDGHEGSLESVKYVDNILYNFLNNLFNDNLLKDTSVFLMSDHGVGMPSIYYGFKFYKMEDQLPMLFMLINDRKNMSYEEQYQYIYENQQIMITGYDVHNTIANILYGNKYAEIRNKTKYMKTAKSKYGISLFNKINPEKRNSKYYQKIGDIRSDVCN